jgi:hypothetical protein
MALLFVDGATGDLQIAGGVGFSGGINNASELAQYIPDVDRNSSIPLAAVKLSTGTTSLDYSMIYDMRDFYTVSKYFEGIGIQDSGTPQGTGTILNFGSNLSVSMAGGVATINGAGGGGGASAILAQDEGVLLGTGTIFNFVGDGVTASISGTVVRVSVPGGGSGTGSANLYRQYSWVSGSYDSPQSLQIEAFGALAVANSVGYLIVPHDGQAESVSMYLVDKGVAGTTTIDVNLNGTTMFTTQANRPMMDYDEADDVVTAIPDIVDVSENDIITFDIDAIATGSAGLVANVKYRPALEWGWVTVDGAPVYTLEELE